MKTALAGTIAMGWIFFALFLGNPESFGKIFKRFDDARYTMQCD
jgi:hypothetical protein